MAEHKERRFLVVYYVLRQVFESKHTRKHLQDCRLDIVGRAIIFFSIMKRKWMLIPVLFFLFLLLLWIVFNPMSVYRLFHPRTEQDVIKEIFTSQDIFNVVMSSQQVTVQILKNDPEDGWPTLATDDKYKPILLSAEQARKIKELLGKPSSYIWGISSECTARYGVVFDFRSGGHIVRVAFCFQCHMMAVFDGDGDNAKDISDFVVLDDPMRKQLMGICKTLFPDDPKIQALK